MKTTGTMQRAIGVNFFYAEEIEGLTIQVAIKVKDQEVQLMRSGDISMDMHFTKAHDTTTLYETPDGTFLLTIKTRSILHFEDANGGKLKVHYELLQDGVRMGIYQFELKYKEQ